MTDQKPLLHDAAAVSERMFGNPDRAYFVSRRMASRRWPSRKVGRGRYMTDADIQQALDIEAVDAIAAPLPPASGLSPRSRHRRAS